MATIIELVNYAISQKKRLHIIYSFNGNSTSMTIEPIKWADSDHILAHDLLSKKEIKITRAAIRSCRVIGAPSNMDSVASSPSDPAMSDQLPYEEVQQESITSTNIKASTASQENYFDPANVPVSSPRLTRKPPTPTAKSTAGIEAIKTSEDWQRLLKYYRACLVHENYQEYVIDQSRDRVQYFDAKPEQLESFLEGQSYLLFHEGKNTDLFRFVTSIQRRNNQQLYIGFPIFVVDASRLAPVLIASVNATQDKDQVRLETTEEGYEVSYAALASLGLRDEEIISVLNSISEATSQKGQFTIPALVDTIIKLTGEILGEDLNRLKSNAQAHTPNTFENRPCLFWANPGTATAKLMQELDTLGTYWSSVPDSLKSLLNVVSEYQYPEAPIESKDRNIYVAPVYERQRQAIVAAFTKPITVVTGPPGTGKSQFILNLIVQAVMRGEKVLFASRNNKAVNVVMENLQQKKVEFPGAIRTGNKDERRKAIDQISARLRELSAKDQKLEDMDVLQDRYWQFQQQYLKKLGLLKEVRLKAGLLTSRIAELSDLRKLIPTEMLSSVEGLSFSFGTDEYEYLQSFLATQRTEGLEFKATLDSLAEEITRQLNQKTGELPLTVYLRNYEDQWGSAGSELLQPANFETIQMSREFLGLWSDFLDAIDNQIHLNTLSTSYRELKAELEKREPNLSESEQVEVRHLSETMLLDELLVYKGKAKACLNQAQTLAKLKGNLWVRFLTWLSIRHPFRDLANQFIDLQKNTKTQMLIPEKPGWHDLEELNRFAIFFSNIFDTAFLTLQTHQTKENLAEARQTLEATKGKLPKLLAENVKKLSPTQEEIAATRRGVQQFYTQVDELTKKIETLKLEIQRKLSDNSDELEFLTALRSTDKKHTLDMWIRALPTEPDVLIGFLSTWRNVFASWKTQDVITSLQTELEAMSTEEILTHEARELGDSLFKLGGKILIEQWKRNSRNMSASIFQGANQYVSAARQLLEGGLLTSYPQIKGMEEDSLPAVMQLFPVWATTNLSAKSNFPLTPGLFDLVIIDEASQCDLPSALPLLYRANRVVIVGDAMQLRHVAKILPNTEEEAAKKYSVSQARYSYSKFSLFDIAHRSVQPSPSTILLNEHYRSDPQIFGFSREEFYPEEVKIFTDISRFSLPADYIKDGTGVFWVDTPGMAHHPGGGSAYNDTELKTISELIPKLLSNLNRQKMDKINLGVISPYREQEKRILNWLDGFQKADPNIQGRITVGTAHKFQGDERDVVIFSPVISQGIKENSQKWLNDTSNLLNVAISRARITMIVVGDWKYCLSLDKDSKYRRLAEYVARHPNRVVNSIDALPIFKGLPLDIIGILLDRHNWQRNRLTLQKLLLACDQYIWWMDPFISNGIFELLIDIAKHPEFKLNDIRILTSREQTRAERNPINPKLVQNVRKEFARSGISIQLGLLYKHEIPHDRYFYSSGYAINMPPFGGAYGEHKMVSEYTESKTKAEFFEAYWSKAEKY